jgi:hypothetical protein
MSRICPLTNSYYFRKDIKLNNLSEEVEELKKENKRLKKELAQERCDHRSCSRDRARYVGPGGTNYINIKCKICGKEWEETD